MKQGLARHDQQTFEYVLSDHLTHHGFKLQPVFKSLLQKEIPKFSHSFEPLCALRYGNHILLISAGAKPIPKRLVWWNDRKKELKKMALQAKEGA